MKWKSILSLIGIALFAYILYRLGPQNLYVAVKNIKASYLIIGVIISLGYTLMQTYKWDLILKLQGIKLNFIDLVIMQFKATYYSLISPSQVGGFVKVAYLKEKVDINVGKAFSSIMIDRVFDLISITFFACVGAFFILNKMNLSIYLFIIPVVLLVTGILIVFNQKIMKTLLYWAYKKIIPKRFKHKVSESFYSFYSAIPQKKTTLIIPFIFNLLTWLLIYSLTYVLSLSLGINVNYFIIISMFSIATLVGLIPVTVSGLGTREATLITLLKLFGVGASKVVILSLLNFTIGSLLTAAIGFGVVIVHDNIYKTRQVIG